MKYVKMLGLAAVATAALMAVVGAGGASATVLCKTEPNTGTTGTTCPVGWAYSKGTLLHSVNVGTVFLHSTFKTIECTKSTIQSTTENEGSATETVKGPIEVFTLEGCNCEVKVLKTGTQETHWITDTISGTVTTNGQEITVNCSSVFGNVHCIYVTNNKDTGEITGGAPAISHVNVTIERKPTNALCDEEAVLTATYEVTSPNPFFFADHT